MEKTLNTIWIGLFKLRVYIAKSRPVKNRALVKDIGVIKSQGSNLEGKGLKTGGRDPRSYAQVVGGREQVFQPAESLNASIVRPSLKSRASFPHSMSKGKQEEYERKQDISRSERANRLLSLVSNQDISEYLKSCIVWFSKEMMSYEEVETCWVAEGLEVVEIKYLHGLVFLVKLENEATVDYLVNNKDHNIYSHCSALKKWEISIHSSRRLAEIEVRGLPIIAWSEENFQKLAGRWGEVLGLINCSFREARQLEAGIATILTDKPSRISSSTTIDIGGEIYRINIEERTSSRSIFVHGPGIGMDTDNLISDVDDSSINSEWLESSFRELDEEEEEIKSSGGFGLGHSGANDQLDEDQSFHGEEMEYSGNCDPNLKSRPSNLSQEEKDFPHSEAKEPEGNSQHSFQPFVVIPIRINQSMSVGENQMPVEKQTPNSEAHVTSGEAQGKTAEEISIKATVAVSRPEVEVPTDSKGEMGSSFGSTEEPIHFSETTSAFLKSKNHVEDNNKASLQLPNYVTHDLSPSAHSKIASEQSKAAPPSQSMHSKAAPTCPINPFRGPVTKPTKPLTGLQNFHINLGKYFDSGKTKGRYVDPVPVTCHQTSLSTGYQPKSVRDIGNLIGFSWESDDQPRG